MRLRRGPGGRGAEEEGTDVGVLGCLEPAHEARTRRRPCGPRVFRSTGVEAGSGTVTSPEVRGVAPRRDGRRQNRSTQVRVPDVVVRLGPTMSLRWNSLVSHRIRTSMRGSTSFDHGPTESLVKSRLVRQTKQKKIKVKKHFCPKEI